MTIPENPNISSCYSQVNGRKIHYLTCGKGDSLVLLHASLSNAKTFTGVIAYLAQDYKVYALDLPGYGESDELSPSFTFEDMAQSVVDWTLQEEIKDFILAGVSMGGTIVVHIAKKIDKNIKGYMLIEPYLGKEELIISKNIIKSLNLISKTFNKIIPTPLGNRMWSSKKTIIFLMKYLNPFKKERRTVGQQLQILQCAKYKTFWRTLDLLFNTELDTKDPVSFKPTLLLMSSYDKSLDYAKTVKGFSQLFPNLQNIPIELADHYPKEPITYRYIETHYPTLLKNVDTYFGESHPFKKINISKPRSKSIKSQDGVNIFYEMRGIPNGKPYLVFLHGLGGDLTAWNTERLALEALGYGSIALDLRGHGFSDHPVNEDAYRFGDFARDVLNVMETEKIKNAVVVGHCFGGMIALTLEANNPNSSHSLVLVDTSYKPTYFSAILAHHAILNKITRLFALNIPNIAIPGHVNFSKFVGTTDFDYKRILSDILHTSLRSYFLICEKLIEYDATNLLNKIHIPTLVIEGTNDSVFPPEVAKQLSRRIKKSQLEFIKGENHILVINDPADLVSNIHKFLQTIDSSR